jgi:hypothetical protein
LLFAAVVPVGSAARFPLSLLAASACCLSRLQKPADARFVCHDSGTRSN